MSTWMITTEFCFALKNFFWKSKIKALRMDLFARQELFYVILTLKNCGVLEVFLYSKWALHADVCGKWKIGIVYVLVLWWVDVTKIKIYQMWDCDVGKTRLSFIA